MRAGRLLGALTACAVLMIAAVGAGGTRASAQEEIALVSASMNSLYYLPGERAYLDVDLELSGEARSAAVRLDLLIYPPATTRSSLASFREGSRRYIMVRRTLETVYPDSEWTDKMYEIDLNGLGLQAGVYPFEVTLTRGGERLSSDQNFLVIMDPSAGYPLNLSLLWTLDFLPYSDALGNELDTGLAAACSSSSSETGFLYALLNAMRAKPEVRSSLVLACSTFEDLEALAGASGGTAGGEAAGAPKVLADLKAVLAGGEADLVNTTYSFADTDLLAARGWEEDVSEQIDLGLAGAKERGGGSKGFAAPLFRLSDDMLQRLVEKGIEFTVVGEEALRASAAGRRLLEGTTISQPVRFVNSNGYLLKAFVRDEALYTYLENASGRDPRHTLQDIFAELAVLQREKPYVVRSCVLAFPPSFMPSQQFVDELYEAVKRCPWVQSRLLSELNADQFPLEGVALQAPVYPVAASSYAEQLEAVREEVRDFTACIPTDHRLRYELRRSLFAAEHHRFTGEKDSSAAQAYLGSVEGLIRGETSKVSIGLKRSVTLSSTEGKLGVDVTSNLDYPLQGVTLRMENPSLTFPQGNVREVTIEPRENRFIFDVDTHRKGSFIVDIVLEANGLVIDSTSITLNTSIINTLAIILLACLVFIVAVMATSRRLLRRYRGGKHAKGKATK